MNMTEWEINGLSLTLDLEDLETMKRYEDAFEKMKQEENSIPKEGLASERITAYCNLYFHLFVNLFGEDDAKQIFSGTSMNSREYENIYFDFLAFVKKQKTDSVQSYAKRMKEYLPVNRKQRRQKQKRRRK